MPCHVPASKVSGRCARAWASAHVRHHGQDARATYPQARCLSVAPWHGRPAHVRLTGRMPVPRACKQGVRQMRPWHGRPAHTAHGQDARATSLQARCPADAPVAWASRPCTPRAGCPCHAASKVSGRCARGMGVPPMYGSRAGCPCHEPASKVSGRCARGMGVPPMYGSRAGCPCHDLQARCPQMRPWHGRPPCTTHGQDARATCPQAGVRQMRPWHGRPPMYGYGQDARATCLPTRGFAKA